MTARGTVLAFVLGLSLLATAPTASAHLAGAPPITRSGSIGLTAKGTNNSTYHGYIANLGIPPGPGDTLRFSWSANEGVGPTLYFEIHAHPNTTGYVRYYSALAARVDDAWSVPGPGDYMVWWDNPNSVGVNVTYTFELLAMPDLTPLLAFPAALGGLVLAIWVDRRRRRKKRTT
jgi:hypothetical protein